MIPQGYKQTEIGVIPEDWELYKFGEKVSVYRGGSPRPITDYISKGNNGVNWIKIGDVKPGAKYINSTEEKIIPEGVSHSRAVHKGDFILSNSMSFGRPYILNIDGCIHDGWLTIQQYQETFDTNYLYYILSSSSIYKQYVSMASGSSVQNLNKEKVSKLSIPAPKTKKEQEKIAEVLSDMDELISSLEKLIAKKKAIKQGTMQQLLTGKTRLPGFTTHWKEMVIGKNGTLLKTSINPQNFSDQAFYEYSMPAYDNGKIPVRSKGMDMHSNRLLIDGEVLLFNKLNVRQKRVWYIKKCLDDAVCSMEFLPYYSEKINLILLAQILKTDKVTAEFVGMSTGTSNSQRRISPTSFLKYSVYLPEDIKEQKAIADILLDMDSEIEQLEQKLTKTRLIKQGMMQQLLTGKIRLV